MQSASERFPVQFELSRYLARLNEVEPLIEFGTVKKVVANTIESEGPNVTVGSLCWLHHEGRRFPVEVVGFHDGKITSMPLSKVDGIRQGDIVRTAHRVATFGVDEKLCGRVLNGMGRPIDGWPLPSGLHQQELYAEPVNPLSRKPIRETIQTGSGPSMGC
jgi:flagellum-specific ATP synthase